MFLFKITMLLVFILQIVEVSTLTCYSGVSITGGVINQNSRSVVQCGEGEVCSQILSDYAIDMPGYSLSGSVGMLKCMRHSTCESQLCEIMKPFLPNIIANNLHNCTNHCCNEDQCNDGTKKEEDSARNKIKTQERNLNVSSTEQYQAAPITCSTGMSISGLPFSADSKKNLECGVDEICSTLNANVSIDLFGSGTIFFGQCLLPEACQMFSCENVLDFIPGSIPVKIDNCETSCCEENLCNFEQYQEITTSIKDFSLVNGVRCLTGYKVSTFGFEEDNRVASQCSPGFGCADIDAKVNAVVAGFTATGTAKISLCLPFNSCSAITCDDLKEYLPVSVDVSVTTCNITCCGDDLCNDETLATSTSTTTLIDEMESTNVLQFTTPKTITDDCGSSIQVTSEPQEFHSPGYPGNYLANRDCEWVLESSSPMKTISITFHEFRTQHCCDYVMIIERSLPARVFRGTQNSVPFTVTGSGSGSGRMLVRFHSDGLITNKGFRASVIETSKRSFSRSSEPCEFVLNATKTSQVLNSPGWAENNSASLVCTWIIKSKSPESFIEINFLQFSTQQCCDVLTIREGKTMYESIKGSPQFLPTLISPSDQVELLFNTDRNSSTLARFQIAYKETKPPTVSRAVTAIRISIPSLSNSYKNWYEYSYDGNRSNIRDGGRDMFDSANMIYILADDGEEFPVLYNRIYRFNGFELQTNTGNPFLSLLWVTNDTKERSLILQVKGVPGSDGEGRTDYYNGDMAVDSFRLIYSSFQISGSNDPTICEVHFVVYNKIDWNSTANVLPKINFNGNLRTLETRIRIKAGEGALTNSLVGYILLSRYPGEIIFPSEIETVLDRLLNSFILYPPYNVTDHIRPDNEPSSTSVVATTSVASITSKPINRSMEVVPRGLRIHEDFKDESGKSEIDNSDIYTNPPTYETGKLSEITSQLDKNQQNIRFLSTCSVFQTIQSISRCEYIFANPVVFVGPPVCSDLIYETIRCVGHQLVQCSMGSERSFLDSYKFSQLNTKSLIGILHNLTSNNNKDPNFGINAFCYLAPQNISYPHPTPDLIPFCDSKILEDLLNEVSEFFYSFAWARTREDICRAFRQLKQWFLRSVEARCHFDYYMNNPIYPPTQSKYVTQALKEAIETTKSLNISACKDETNLENYGKFRSFACPEN